MPSLGGRTTGIIIKNLLYAFLLIFLVPKIYTVTPAPHPARVPVLAPKPPISAPIPALRAYVADEAIRYGINPNLAFCIIGHESQWNATAFRPERRGASVGLWQIDLFWNPQVTMAEADDYAWATKWSLARIASGRASLWSTYAKYCSAIPVHTPS